MSQVDYKYIWSIEPSPNANTPRSSTSSAPTQMNVLSSVKNTKEEYLEAVRILLLLLDNILKYPNELKYRSIRIENKLVKERLLTLEGLNELLIAIGFKRTASEYNLPLEASLDVLQAYRDALIKRRDYWSGHKEGVVAKGTYVIEFLF